MNKICINIDENFFFKNDFLERLKEKKDTEITINFISDFKSAKLLRDFVWELSENLGIDRIWKSRLILIIDELNNNAIEYWSKPGDYNTFKTYIKFNTNSLLLNIEVSDTWKWKSPKTAKEMILIRNKLKLKWFHKNNWIRWRWLFMIIEKLVDRLYFKDAENWWLTVWIEKRFEIKK